MNSFRITGIIIAIMVLCAGPSHAIFENKELIALREAYDKAVKENDALKLRVTDLESKTQNLGDVDSKYQALVKENEAIKQDRANLMAQAKSLLGASTRTKELEDLVSKLRPESSNLINENNKLRSDSEDLKKRLLQLSSENSGMMKELSKPKIIDSAEKLQAEIKELNKQLVMAKLGNSKLNVRIAKEIKNSAILEAKMAKLEASNTSLQENVKKYKNEITDAIKKNKEFEKAIQNLPKKFAETARQNRQLIQETAEMHYNMGVFYIQHKEFERARAELEKSVEINPDDANSRFNLGYIYAEQLVDRKKAILQFKNYLRLAKTDGKDVDWAKKYILTWQTFEGKEPME